MSATNYLHGLGINCALGRGIAAVRANWQAAVAPGLQMQSGWMPARELGVGQVQSELPAWPERWARFASRNSRLLADVAKQLTPEIDAALGAYGADRIGVVIGSSTSGIAEGEAAVAAALRDEMLPGFHYRQQEIGAPALALAKYLGITGPALTVSTACSSSARAFASARNLLQLDLCDAVLVGGADSLCKLTLNGFAALDAVASTWSAPFCVNRDGINIGEGAALFLLSREPAPVALLGVGESSDAHHISAPEPEGRGAEQAMRAALQQAGIAPTALHYINLHGTGTPLNDAMESKAVARLCGDLVPCTSTKTLTGHTLGAAGAIEAALCWLLLTDPQAQLPAQIFRGEPDTTLAPLGLAEHPQQLPPTGTRYCLSNSFAFGGNNCALVLAG